MTSEIILKPLNNITPRLNWDLKFSNAIKEGYTPDDDLFLEINNEFDEEEWTW